MPKTIPGKYNPDHYTKFLRVTMIYAAVEDYQRSKSDNYTGHKNLIINLQIKYLILDHYSLDNVPCYNNALRAIWDIGGTTFDIIQ